MIKGEEQTEIDPKILKEIIEAVQQLRHGEVVITVYHSKVVQIQKTEKKRFT